MAVVLISDMLCLGINNTAIEAKKGKNMIMLNKGTVVNKIEGAKL